MTHKIAYDNLVDTLLFRFPEFANSKFYNQSGKNLQYVVFGFFGQFLISEIESNRNIKDLLDRAFSFINELYNQTIESSTKPKDSVQNIIQIELFETIAGDEQASKLAAEKLVEQAKEDFLEYVK